MFQKLRPHQPQVDDLARLHIDPMQLEHPLRRIHADHRSVSLHLGPSCLPVKSSLFQTGTLMPSAREGPTQPSRLPVSGGGRRPFHFPSEHRTKIHSTNPSERVNKEIKRRTNVVGIFANDDAIVRLVGAILLEQNDEWAVSRRYMTLETVARLDDPEDVTPTAIAAA